MIGRFAASLCLSAALSACGSRALRPQRADATTSMTGGSVFDGGGPSDGVGPVDAALGEAAPAGLPDAVTSSGLHDSGTAVFKDSGGLHDAAATTISDSGAQQDAAADTRRDSLPATGEDSCPPQGQSCGFGALCSWGEPIEVACRWSRDCYHTWMPKGRNTTECSTDLGKPGCPDRPPASGEDCAFQELACVYPNGPDCECVPDSSTGAADARPDSSLPGVWRCAGRQNPPECPASAPYLYSRCSTPRSNEILFCNYACFRYQCEPSQNFWTGDTTCWRR
jgi:hypothetical protein